MKITDQHQNKQNRLSLFQRLPHGRVYINRFNDTSDMKRNVIQQKRKHSTSRRRK